MTMRLESTNGIDGCRRFYRSDEGDLTVEICEIAHEHDKNGIMTQWVKRGWLPEFIEKTLSVRTYYEDGEGNCWGRYNPQAKTEVNEDGNPYPGTDFDWVLEATPENERRLLEECERLMEEDMRRIEELEAGHPTKTHRGWMRSGKGLDEYLEIGDNVTEDLVDRMMDSAPPVTLGGGGLFQAGGEHSSAPLPNVPLAAPTYATFARLNGRSVYCGDCVAGSLFPRADDLVAARPDLEAAVSEMETTAAPALRVASRKSRAERMDGDVWHVRRDYTQPARDGEPRITRAYLPDRSGSLNGVLVAVELKDGAYEACLYGTDLDNPVTLGGFSTFEDAYAASMEEAAAHVGIADRFARSGYRLDEKR